MENKKNPREEKTTPALHFAPKSIKEQAANKRFVLTYGNYCAQMKINTGFRKISMVAAPTQQDLPDQDPVGLSEEQEDHGPRLPMRFNEAEVARRSGNRGRHFKLAATKHIFEENHNIGIEDANVIKKVNDQRKMDFFRKSRVNIGRLGTFVD